MCVIILSFVRIEGEHNIPRLHHWHECQLHQYRTTNLSSPVQASPLAAYFSASTAVTHRLSEGYKVMLSCIYPTQQLVKLRLMWKSALNILLKGNRWDRILWESPCFNPGNSSLIKSFELATSNAPLPSLNFPVRLG